MAYSQAERRPTELSQDVGDARADNGVASAEDLINLSSYIADMSGELATLAGRAGMPMLTYFLNLARVEAETRCRELGGYPISRRRD